MPFGVSLPELIILLVVLLLVFGAKRLPEMGSSLGKGMREFKDAVSGEETSDESAETTTATRHTRRAPVRAFRRRAVEERSASRARPSAR